MTNTFNTTFAATMTNTKPAFKKLSASAVSNVDEWDNVYEDIERPKEYLEFNTPPLGLVVAMQEAGKQGYEIYETLVGAGKLPHVRADTAISVEHQKKAAEIYNYFAKKHTIRRLKGEYISEFMLVVDELCENRTRIDLEHVKVLLSLPRFYNQNRALERVMKERNSVKEVKSLPFAAFKGEVEFVERVHVKYGRTNEYQYYFSTPKNYLMRIVVKKGDYGVTAWDTLVKSGKLYIDTEVVYTFPIKGYDFNVLQPSPEQMEITIV